MVNSFSKSMFCPFLYLMGFTLHSSIYFFACSSCFLLLLSTFIYHSVWNSALSCLHCAVVGTRRREDEVPGWLLLWKDLQPEWRDIPGGWCLDRRMQKLYMLGKRIFDRKNINEDFFVVRDVSLKSSLEWHLLPLWINDKATDCRSFSKMALIWGDMSDSSKSRALSFM